MSNTQSEESIDYEQAFPFIIDSIFTNEVFAIIYTILNILESTEAQSTSPIQTSRHTKVRNEMHFLHFYTQFVKMFTIMMFRKIPNTIYKKY